MESKDAETRKRILLCADTESLMHPELLGLEDVALDGHEWLEATADADEARRMVNQDTLLQEVWISSTDEVSALNLAAALRQDKAELTIRLIMFSPTGSFMSNATAVGACEVLNETTFPQRFAEASSRRIRVPSDPGGVNAKPSPSHASQKESRGIVVPVVSGSGGSGKSSVSALLGMLLAERGASTVVLDLDLQFGDMHRLLGYEAPLSINDILSDGAAREALAPSRHSDGEAPARPALVAAPARLEHADLVAQSVGDVVELCASLFDVVVVNTGAAWVEHHASLLEKSICPVFLIDQRASSVFACKHALDLCTRMGIATSSFLFVLNRCARDAMFTAIDVAIALQGAHVLELKDGGNEVEELLSAGMATELAATRNEMVKSVRGLLDEIIALNPRIPHEKVAQYKTAQPVGRTLLGRRRKARAEGKGAPSEVSLEAIHAGLNSVPALAMG